MLFPSFSRRHRLAPLFFVVALAALLAGAIHPATSASATSERGIETLTAAWLYPLLAVPVLVRLLESDAP